MKKISLIFCWFISTAFLIGQDINLPIIDMHLHALDVNDFTHKTEDTITVLSQKDYEEQVFTALEKHNIIAVASGPHEIVKKWHRLKPDRIIPGLLIWHPNEVSVDSMRKWHSLGELDVIGEVAIQYDGMKPDDPEMEKIWNLAEELDIPLAIHMVTGPAGAAYGPFPKYRGGLIRPLDLEEILIKHPKVRFNAMHAGWPFLDEIIALLHFHPQVYVDIGVLTWYIPRAEFYNYLERIVNAGFGKRIMFGTDQMIWPETIKAAIESIENAKFLTPEQKRDIFYNNAAEFLQLSKEQIAKHRAQMR